MKVIVLAHALQAGGGISVGQNFTAALKYALPDSDFWVTVPRGLSYETFIGNSRCKFYAFEQRNYLQQWYFENISLPILVKAENPDIVIALANRALPRCPFPQVMLLHDSHLFYSSRFYAGESKNRKALKAFQRFVLGRDLPKLSALLVQTSTAEQRVRELYNFKGRVVQLPNAISVKVTTGEDYAIPEAYLDYQELTRFFYLTRYYPHKNIELIVEAFEQYPQQLEKCRVFITIAADQHPKAKVLLERIDKSCLNDRIINVGPLAQEQLAAYFQHCNALLMPTTLESFSGTYLEAMSFGTPILTSDLDFAKEICADAALYFEPWSAGSLCDAMTKLSDDKNLPLQLAQRGKARLNQLQWDWNKNAERIVNLLPKIMNEHNNETSPPRP